MQSNARVALLRAALAVGGAALPLLVSAAVPVSEPILEEVVVTATRTSGTILRSPLTLTLIDPVAIRRSTADGIADLMRDVPGVSISDSGEAGMKRVRFRGEESRRVAVLIDGQEMTDHREVGVPLLIDPALVERIEVVRGPASVLYGAKALSGVVNIITRKGGERAFEGVATTTYSSATQGWHESLAAFGALGDWRYRGFLARNRQDERHTPAGTMENTAYESDSASVYLERLLANGSLAVTHDRERASSSVYVAPEVRHTFPFLDFAIDVPQRDRTRTGVFYTFSPGEGALEQVQVNAYRQIGERQFNTFSELMIPFPPPGMHIQSDIYTHSRLTTEGALVQFDWRPSVRHYVVTGVQYGRDRVDQRRHKDTTVNAGATRIERIHDDARITTWGVFAQDEWTLAEDWSLVAGMRDYRVEAGLEETDRPSLAPGERTDTHAVVSASLLHAASAATTWRATFSEGYVYPSLLQLATGAYAGAKFINPQLDLTPETSRNLEFGARHQGARWTLDATVFASRANDYIDHVDCRASDPCLTPADEIYRNIGESRAYGVEVAGSMQLANGLEPHADLTLYRRRNAHEGAHTWKSGIPPVAATAGVRYARTVARTGIEADLFVRFEASTEELDITSPGSAIKRNGTWSTINLDLGCEFRGPFRVDLALRNLANREYRTATENLYGEERSIAAKVTLSL